MPKREMMKASSKPGVFRNILKRPIRYMLMISRLCSVLLELKLEVMNLVGGSGLAIVYRGTVSTSKVAETSISNTCAQCSLLV